MFSWLDSHQFCYSPNALAGNAPNADISPQTERKRFDIVPAADAGDGTLS